MSRRTVLLSSLSLFTLACQPPAPEGQGATAGSDEAPSQAWTVEDVAPNTADGVRILIIHDMEGLSGQSDPSSFDFGTDLYPTGQEWLAADINAVVDGLYAGGATEVVIAGGDADGGGGCGDESTAWRGRRP